MPRQQDSRSLASLGMTSSRSGGMGIVVSWGLSIRRFKYSSNQIGHYKQNGKHEEHYR